MPRLDQCHDQVVRALQKEGWRVEDAPFRLILPPRVGYADIRMSHGSNGRAEQIILLEVKCFPDTDSTTRDLYGSIGQYLIYRAMILELELTYPLYLTVPDDIFDKIFDTAVLRVVKESKINVVIINLEAERVVKWMR